MKIGIIGFGSIGNRHYKNIKDIGGNNCVILSSQKDVQLHKEDLLVWTKSEFKHNGPFDVIFVTNETSKHLDSINFAIKVGTKAIFVEKPISDSIEGLSRIKKLIERKKISFWVGYNFHYFEPFLLIRNKIRSGDMGRIYSMRVSVGQDLRSWRKRDYRLSYSASKQFGGGVLLDLIHDINYPAWMIGDEIIPKVCVVGRKSSLEIDTEDLAETIFVSKRDKIIISIHQDYLRLIGKRSLEIVGSKASVFWDSLSNEVILETQTDRNVTKFVSDYNKMYKDEILTFLESTSRGEHISNFAEAYQDLVNIKKVKRLAQKNVV